MFIFREGNETSDEMSITYDELLKQVCKFANVLKSKGKFNFTAVVPIFRCSIL